MKSPKLDWALHHAGRGLHVFPVKPDTKHPAIENWPDLATTDPAQISEWWEEWPDANIGVHPGASGHVVIDIDTKKVDGKASFKQLEATFGDVPETLVTETPTGGLHVWLTLDGSCRNSAGSLAPGIDTRGVRGFVLMAGSEIGGQAYTDNGGAICAAPERWRAPLQALGAKAEHREAVEGFEVDHPGNIERAQSHVRGLIERGDVAISGSGGNDRTYRLAAALRGYGLSEGKALEVAEPWNERCVPPWDAEELERIFFNAYEYAQNEIGARALTKPTGEGFACIPAPSGATQANASTEGSGQAGNKFRPLSIDEMTSLPEPSWLIPGWLAHYELSLMFGAYGSFKSFAALDMALSVAAGIPCLGLDHHQRKFSVIYIAGEGQLGLAKQRVPAWLNFHGISGDDLPFHLIREAPLARNGGGELAQLFAAIEEVCADNLPRLIVFDTHARSMSGFDENSVQDTSKTVEFYEQILRRYSCAGLLVHHAGLDGSRERGSTALGGACFAIFNMEYDKASRTAILSCKKMKDAPEPDTLYLQPTPADPSLVLTPKQYEKPTREKTYSEMYLDVVRILKENEAHTLSEALTTAAVASQMPAVHDEPTPEGQERAKRLIESSLNKLAKKELRPLTQDGITPLRWRLPPLGEQ